MRAGALAQEHVEQQVREQEVAEMVHGEGELEAVGARDRAPHLLDPRVQHQGVERRLACPKLLDGLPHRGERAEVEPDLVHGIVAGLADDALHGLLGEVAVAARDDHAEAIARQPARTLESDARVPPGDQHGLHARHDPLLTAQSSKHTPASCDEVFDASMTQAVAPQGRVRWPGAAPAWRGARLARRQGVTPARADRCFAGRSTRLRRCCG
jgi:hypothetical protein